MHPEAARGLPLLPVSEADGEDDEPSINNEQDDPTQPQEADSGLAGPAPASIPVRKRRWKSMFDKIMHWLPAACMRQPPGDHWGPAPPPDLSRPLCYASAEVWQRESASIKSGSAGADECTDATAAMPASEAATVAKVPMTSLRELRWHGVTSASSSAGRSPAHVASLSVSSGLFREPGSHARLHSQSLDSVLTLFILR